MCRMGGYPIQTIINALGRTQADRHSQLSVVRRRDRVHEDDDRDEHDDRRDDVRLAPLVAGRRRPQAADDEQQQPDVHRPRAPSNSPPAPRPRPAGPSGIGSERRQHVDAVAYDEDLEPDKVQEDEPAGRTRPTRTSALQSSSDLVARAYRAMVRPHLVRPCPRGMNARDDPTAIVFGTAPRCASTEGRCVDRDLVETAQRGDQAAFVDLIRRASTGSSRSLIGSCATSIGPRMPCRKRW